RRLGDLVTPLEGKFLRPGASTVYREQGRRFIAVKFSVNREKRDLASTVAEAQEKVQPLIPAGYRTEWSGEFEGMRRAESRLAKGFAVSMVVIVLMIYLAFRSARNAAG